MRWAIEVRETQLPRRNLLDLLDRLGFTLVEELPNVAFTSAKVDECATAHEVFEIAKRVRDAFTGSANIDPDFKLGSVIDCSTVPPNKHGFAEGVLIATLQSVVFAGTATVGPRPNLSEEQLREWRAAQAEADYRAKLEAQLSKLVPAYISPKASRVLELLAMESHSGESLYKIYELMRGPRTNAMAFGQQFGITDEDFRRFSDAVHLDSVTGDWARHAHGDPPKSVNPMTKGEAELFVRCVAARWLQHIRSSGGA